jgi:hypothetical protein
VSKDISDGSQYVALFNLSEEVQTVAVSLAELGVKGTVSLRDLWLHEDLGGVTEEIWGEICGHGAKLFRIDK